MTEGQDKGKEEASENSPFHEGLLYEQTVGDLKKEKAAAKQRLEGVY